MIIVGDGSICRAKTLADEIRSHANDIQPLLVVSASMQITNPYQGLNEQQDYVYVLPSLQNNRMSNRAKRRKAERDAKKKKR